MEFFIFSITQIDSKQFSITWSDGQVDTYSLAQLQAACPCSACSDGSSFVEEGVSALKIKSIGSYAIGIEYTSGCSRGVYPYALLRSLTRDI